MGEGSETRSRWRARQASAVTQSFVAIVGALFLGAGLSPRAHAEDLLVDDDAPHPDEQGEAEVPRGCRARPVARTRRVGRERDARDDVRARALLAARGSALRLGRQTGASSRRCISFSASVGGRGYLTTRDIEPVPGRRAVAPDASHANDASPDESFSVRPALASYLEVGVEALRLHRARVALALRVDLPTFALRSEEYYGWDPATGRSDDTLTRSAKYVWPVSIGVSVAF